MILCGVFLGFSEPDLFVFAIPLLALGLFYCFGIRWTRRSAVKRNLKQLLSQGRADTLLGDFTYRLTTEVFEKKSTTGYDGTYWNAFYCIEETDDYLFIFNSSISAYIVPKRELTEGEVDELKSILTRQFNSQSDAVGSEDEVTPTN